MLTGEIRAVIPGHPVTKGSLKCIGRRGKVAHVVIESDESGAKAKWREFIARTTKQKWPTEQFADARQPVGAEITFTLERPKAHYGTGRNAGTVKPQFVDAMPVGHDTGDVDKLLRLVLDALQDAGIFPDDCAVVEALSRKTFVHGPPLVPDALGHPGVVIRLFPYDPAGAPT